MRVKTHKHLRIKASETDYRKKCKFRLFKEILQTTRCTSIPDSNSHSISNRTRNFKITIFAEPESKRSIGKNEYLPESISKGLK